ARADLSPYSTQLSCDGLARAIRTAQQFCHSAARGLQRAAARRAASRKTRRGSAGPTNGRASAAMASWPADAVALRSSRADRDQYGPETCHLELAHASWAQEYARCHSPPAR